MFFRTIEKYSKNQNKTQNTSIIQRIIEANGNNTRIAEVAAFDCALVGMDTVIQFFNTFCQGSIHL